LLRKGVKLGFTLREGHRLRVLENRALRRIFGPDGEVCIMRSFVTCTLH